MKNFVRICMAVLALGAVCCAVGAAAGGELYASAVNGRLLPIGNGQRPAADDADGGSGAGRHGIRSPVWEPAVPDIPDTLPDIDGSLPSVQSLKELDFELGAGEYTIVTGEGYGLEYEGSWISSAIDDGVWELRTPRGWFNLGVGEARVCTITVPEGCTVEALNLDIGAANVQVLAPIHAESVDIDLGAGNLAIDVLDVSDEINLDVGAGNLELGLTGSWADYRIDADVAMGSISIDGQDLVSGFAGTASQGSGSRRINADLGMGHISIRTGQ